MWNALDGLKRQCKCASGGLAYTELIAWPRTHEKSKRYRYRQIPNTGLIEARERFSGFIIWGFYTGGLHLEGILVSRWLAYIKELIIQVQIGETHNSI